MTNYLRPDELVTESEIRKAKTRTNDVRSGLQAVSSLGTTALSANAASKILPLINQYIPEDLALKGINKIMPSVGNFLKNGMKQGLSLQSGLDFLKSQLNPKQSNQTQSQENPVIKQSKDFETNYPDIVKALMGYINNGQSPEAAAAILKQSTPFRQKINKIEKETGKNFVDFVLEMMGGNQTSQIQEPQQSQQQATQATPVTPQQGQGQGLDPQLAQLMQGIRSTIQNLRGGNG